jgi:HK97 gp10 family phage protein
VQVSYIQLETERITQLQAALPMIADELVMAMGEAVISEISAGWSAESPSSPGEAPAVMTGELVGSIQFVMTGSGQAQVGSSAEHAAPLEFGTGTMAARPFLRPAIERVRVRITNLVREGFAGWMR